MNYQKLLLPVDGSSHSRLAAQHAIKIATSCGIGTVILLHSIGEIPAIIGGEAREELMKEASAAANAMLAEYRELLKKSGVPFEEKIVHGGPGRTIVEVAMEEKCDLIVMGSRGMSDFEGMVMGSVTHRVLRHAHAPVLVVR